VTAGQDRGAHGSRGAVLGSDAVETRGGARYRRDDLRVVRQKVERALGGVEASGCGRQPATRTATVRGDVGGLSLIGAVSGSAAAARQRDPRRKSGLPSPAPRGGTAHLAILALTFLAPDGSGAGVLAGALPPVVFWAGWPFLRNAARSARHGSTTMDTLIALGACPAYLYSAWMVWDVTFGPAAGSVARPWRTSTPRQ
jgi:cation transport ATPase